MSSSMYFSPMLPLAWLLPVSLVLLVLFVWLEFRKPYRFKTIRVIAQALAVLAVLGLLLRPSWDVKEERPGLIVLTDNFSQHTLDSLVRAESGLKVVSVSSLTPESPKGEERVPLGSSLTPESPKGEERVPSGSSLTPESPEGEERNPLTREERDKVGSLTSPLGEQGVGEVIESYRTLEAIGQIRFVLGDGIPSAYLETVSNTFRYFPGTEPSGVVELSQLIYPEHRRVFLSGKVRGSKGSHLSLRGPGGVEDSVAFKTNSLVPFELGFTTKVPGRYVYTLMLTDSSGRKTTEDLPIEVAASRKLSVLLLQAYPQAEVRFLKNYLAEKGHGLVTRYQVSRNIFRYEAANGVKQPLGMLNEDKLEAFDLVVADNESLSRISGEERRALEQSVQRGLGLLVLLEGMPDTRQFPGSVLQLTKVPDVPDTIRHRVGGFGSFASPYVAVKASQRVQPLHRSGGVLLQGLTLVGEGKVAVQTLRETYRLALGGDNSAYAALWTPLLEQASRRLDVPVKASVSTPFPIYPGEPVDFEVIGPQVKVVSPTGNAIPLAEDLLVDDRWTGRWWADDAGWGTLTVADSVERHLFVSKPGSWKALRAEIQHQENRLVSVAAASPSTVTRRKEVEPLIFFILFVLSSAFVWLAPKL